MEYPRLGCVQQKSYRKCCSVLARFAINVIERSFWMADELRTRGLFESMSKELKCAIA
jgi:hypothetical protein